jgi:hypothetical protein
VSKSWSSLDAKQKDSIAAVFGALNTLDALSEAVAEETQAERVGFRDLVAWVKGPPIDLPLDCKRALLANPSLRRDFDRLLSRTAVWRCERAAAASTGQLDTREGEGFRVRLKPSRGAAGQVYLLIEFTREAPSSAPQTLVVTGPDGECVRLPLPELQDGTAQILTDEGTDIVRLLRDPKTEILLW